MIPASVLSIDATKSKIFSICEIRPYLFIAGYGALSHQKIKDLGITHAIDVTNNSNNQRFIGVKYFDVKIDDNEKADIKKHFIEASAFIQKAKESGGKALVFCAAGMSRSASICIMYLAIEENMTIKDAFIEIGKVRPIISPNLGFWRQMIEYEIEKRGETSVNLLNGNIRPDVYLSSFQRKRKSGTLKVVEFSILFSIFICFIVLVAKSFSHFTCFNVLTKFEFW